MVRATEFRPSRGTEAGAKVMFQSGYTACRRPPPREPRHQVVITVVSSTIAGNAGLQQM